MGTILDLPSPEWFGNFPEHLRIHIIDSTRPQNLSSLFGPDQKIVVWDDGGAEELVAQKEAWEALAFAAEIDSEDESDDDLDEDEEEDYDRGDDEFEEGSSTGKRRRSSSASPTNGKKRRKKADDVSLIILATV